MISGVFEIRNTVNNRVYIGSGTDIKRVKSWLYSRLWRGVHPCRSLQREFTATGGKNFVFRVLVECSSSEFSKYQKKYQNTRKLYRSESTRNRPHLTLQHRSNISSALAGQSRQPMSQETKDKISESMTQYQSNVADVKDAQASPVSETLKGVYDD